MWGTPQRCMSCGVYKNPADFDQYPPEITGVKGWCAECVNKKRIISPLQEQILRMVHQDFEALSFDDAAWSLATSDSKEDMAEARRIISKALAEVRAITDRLRIPLFPILTKFERDCVQLFVNDNMKQSDIATRLSARETYGDISKNAVTKAIGRCRTKGLWIAPKRFRGNGPGNRILRFDDRYMGAFVMGNWAIVQKF